MAVRPSPISILAVAAALAMLIFGCSIDHIGFGDISWTEVEPSSEVFEKVDGKYLICF
jgi:hypothetical protein